MRRKRRAGQTIQIPLSIEPEKIVSSKVELYKVDEAGGNEVHDHQLRCEGQRAAVISLSQTEKRRADSIFGDIFENVGAGSLQREEGKGGKKKRGMEIWLKTDSAAVVFDRMEFLPDMFVLHMNKSLLSASAKIKRHFGKNIRNIIWALPPVQFERDLYRLQKMVRTLLRSGYKNFQLAHLYQKELIEGERVNLFADYTFNIANSFSLQTLADAGFRGAQAAIELDKKGFMEMLSGYKESALKNQGGGRRIRFGLTIFGAPPLFTSRLDASFFRYAQSLVSPKKEEFLLKKEEGLVLTLPVRPFSLLPYLNELAEMGFNYGVIDVSRMKLGEREKKEIADRLAQKRTIRKLPTFNYLGGLE